MTETEKVTCADFVAGFAEVAKRPYTLQSPVNTSSLLGAVKYLDPTVSREAHKLARKAVCKFPHSTLEEEQLYEWIATFTVGKKAVMIDLMSEAFANSLGIHSIKNRDLIQTLRYSREEISSLFE